MSENAGRFLVETGKFFDVIGVNDILIAEMNEKYLPLKINGIDDKAGYEAVKEGIRLYTKLRTGAVKYAEDDRKAAVLYQKANIAEEKRVVALAAIGEDHLRAEKKVIDDQVEAIKQAEARKEQERIQGRIDRLSAFGMGLFGVDYRLPYPGTTIPQSMISIMNDNDFDQFCVSVHAAQVAEADRLAEIEARRLADEAEKARLAKEESDRIAKERADQDAERARMNAMAKELEDQKAALKAEQDKIEAEKKAAEVAKQKAIDDEIQEEKIKQARQEAARQAVIDLQEKAKKEEAEKAEADRLAAEKEARRIARMPDKTAMLNYLKGERETTKLGHPSLKTDVYREILDNYAAELDELIKRFIERTKEVV